MSVRILIGDVRARLAELPADHFDCVVTSPPYWGLRDYGTAQWEGGDAACDHRSPTMREGRDEQRAALAGSAATNSAQLLLAHRTGCGKCGAVKTDLQIGLEPTLGEHLAVMVGVMREVRRVLKPTGTLWLNYGDCYATSPNGRSAADTKALGGDDRTFRDKPFSTIGGVLKAKDLCMVPNRLAIALQEDGWWVRSEIVWAKPNPMPESIKDRPAGAHEKIFLLSKAPRYFYDAEAVRQAAAESSEGRWAQDLESQEGSHRANGGTKTNGTMKAVGGPRRDSFAREHKASDGTHGQKAQHRPDREGVAYPRGAGRSLRNYEPAPVQVWPVATAAFSEAHFATFPPELAERCIRAGASAMGCCAQCGKPWLRQTSVTYENPGNRTTNGPRSAGRKHESSGFAVRLEKHVETMGWGPDCGCGCDEIVQARVLDPFGGAGTVGLVADRYGLDCTLIELNPEYAEIARRRIEGDAGMFSDVVAA